MTYGYGYAPYTPVAPSPYPYAPLARPYYANGFAVFGANGDANPPSFLDSTKNWLNAETAGVQNKYLVAGAGAIGLIVYGASAGWFGR